MLSEADRTRKWGSIEAPRKLILLGLGAIGRGALPMIFRHFDVAAERVVAISARKDEAEFAQEYNIAFKHMVLVMRLWLCDSMIRD